MSMELSPDRRRRRAAARKREEAEWKAKSGPVRIIKPPSPQLKEALDKIEQSLTKESPLVVELRKAPDPRTPGQVREIERLRKQLGLPEGDPIPETFHGAQRLVDLLFQEANPPKKKRASRPSRSRTWDADLTPVWRRAPKGNRFVIETHKDNTPKDLSEPIAVSAKSGKTALVWLRQRIKTTPDGWLWEFSEHPPQGVKRAA